MDKALKQRLVGAIVLIALAVIVLPMIFGGRPSNTGPDARTIELPAAPPDLDFETRRFPVGDQAETPRETASQPEFVAEEAPADPPPQSLEQELPPNGIDGTVTDPPEVAEADLPPDESAGGDADPAPADSMDALVAELLEPEPAGADLRYVVQVASFGNSENAVRLAGELKEAGYAVLLDQVSSDTGQLNRVRVGPYSSEADARQVAATLGEGFEGVNPRVVDMQPDAAGPALASDDPMMRWVVQVGSFSSQDNARDLVSRLRESGLSAFDETLSTDTSTIYRVRVGPYLDRSQALDAERQIADEIGIDGVVMSSD